MASRHEIVTIDFRANAAKANPAMDSLREAARGMRTEIEKTEAAIANGKATGMAQEELEKLGSTLTAQERKLRSFESAMASLSKGVGTLARAIDAFNAGTLQNMSAAFQKSSFNAAEAAKKALVPGTKDYEKNMAELDALQQKNLENLAKYKLRTEQMLKSIGEGGKISTTDLKQEADGIQELMKLLPHMGHEWQEYNHILTQINDAIKQQADAEKRLMGVIADANDARQRSRQLTRDGADAAAREREAAEKEISLRNDNIASLKKEQEAKQRQVASSAAIVQAKEKEIEKARKGVAYAQQMIDNEEKTERALRKQIETLNTQADTFDKNANSIKGAVDAMKGEVDGLDAELKKVNADLEKMGPATQAAAKGGAAGGASKEAAADKKEEKQAVEEKAEADKKEEQTVRNKTKAKKEEKQAVKENTEAKKEEVKADEKAAEAEKKEELTTDQILKRQDELKAQLQELYKEKKDYARLQEQNAAAAKKEAEAVKEEANAYKDLTKEQAEAKLREKQLPLTTITKGEDGSFSFTNAEEAQHFIMDSIAKMGGYNNGKYSLSDKDKINQLLAQFGERYGVSGDDTVGAVRGLFKAGGYMSGGVMNPFIGRMEPEATEGYAAYAKDVKDLTAVIEGNTEAKKENIKVTEESAKAKRTEADIDKDIAEKEAESRRLTLILRKKDSGAVEAIEKEIEKNENLNASRKKSIELLKQTIEEYKTLSVEKAKAETDAMKAKSTVGYKGGRLDMSNPEEVQSWLIGQAKSISGKKGNGAISLEGGQVDKLLEGFSKRYGWTSDTSTSKKLLKEIIQGEGGLFKGGGFADFSGGNLSVTIKQNAEAIEKRNAKLQALTAISGGAAEGIEKVTDATKEDTDATKIWAKEVERRYQKYLSVQKEVDKLDEEIDKKRKRKRSLPKTGTDALLERERISGEIETYKAENLYENKKNSADLLKKSWESSAKTLAEMMGLPAVEEVKQETAAENQNAEATEKAAKSKRGKKQAVKEAADAQKEEVKAGEEAVKQEEKLSEEEQKRQKLLEKKAELEGKIADKNSEITKKTEEAAGLEVKANNSRDEAKKKIDELTGAHERNERALKTSQGILENLEKTQDGYTKKLNEQRGELGEINKKIDENAEKRLEAEQKQAQAQKLTIDDMNEAVKVLEARNRAIEPEGKEWQENTRLIQQYKAEIDRLKNQPVLQMMTERMGSLKDLSIDALAETKKYWQQMVDGTERGNSKLAAYESNLKAVAEEERRRSLEVQAPMRERLNNLPNLSNADLAETKRYWQAMRDGLDQTTAAYKKAELAVKALENEEERRKANAQAQHINDMMRDLNNLSTSGLAEVKRYWQAMADGAKHGSDEAKDAEKALKSINELENQRSEKQAGEVIGNMKNYSDTEISAAVKTFEQLRDAQAHGKDEWKRFNDLVKQGKQYLEELARTDTLEKMEANMKNLANLSDAALAETKKFWESMKAGAEQGSGDLQKAEWALRDIAETEKRRRAEKASDVLDNIGKYGIADIKAAVQEMERLSDSVKHGGLEWTKYNRYVEQGKKYLDDIAQTDALTKMEMNMANLATLSDAARAETKKFFETMKAGAEQGSAELTKAEAHLESIKKQELADNQKKAQIVLTGTLENYSESEIRESIEAAQAFRKELRSGSDEAKQYADAIAKAEAHVKKYGVESARTAQQQKENDRLMQDQLNLIISDKQSGVAMPSASQLKAQKQYWQRLIDDPKTAASSLQQYRDRLAEVEQLEKELVEINGKTALAWFQQGSDKDASGNKIKEMADKLKEYRGTLLQETNGDEIKQIDAFLQKVGMSAKKATEDLMDFEKAKELAMQAGNDIYGSKNTAFLASPEEIQAATKSIEKYREELFKTIKAKRDSGEATDAEEQELKELAKYLKDLKFEQDNFNMSREKMETLIKTPVSAANLDELRAAIKRADAELRRMEGSLDENSDKYKELAADVKNAKGILKEMEGQAKATTSAFDKAWSRLKTYVGLYVGASVAMNKLVGTMGDLIDLSDKMGEVQKTTGFTADEVGHLAGELKKLDTRTTINGLLDLSVAAGQLGLKTEEDVRGFTEAANKLMVALPEMGREGATEMLKVALATGEISKIEKEMRSGILEGSSPTALAMEKIGSTIDRLRATSAATAPAITDFVKRVGAVGAQSGITIDQVAALGSTVDALGMRVEMSATAISRMIPAIKNNAFALAQAIGVTPETIRNLFDTGRGMEVILMVLQRIKDSGMDADSIENMLGMAGMKDIMKDLNQQGARAGIVFAGLSQNVDTLRKHLVTANEAYEENVAIQNEYNKMNDTTAAKWERLKNQIEETFVGYGAQRLLGSLIEGLRKIVDLLTGSGGVSVALRSVLLYLGLVKLQLADIAKGALMGIWTGLKNIGIMLGFVKGQMTKLQFANIFTAALGAVLYFVTAMKDAATAVSAVAKAIAQLEEDFRKEIRTLQELFHAVSKTNVELERSRSRLEEVKKAGGDATDAENRLKKANAEHAATIREINSKYGAYLGYMLSETSSAEQLARARELINSKLRETITLKQREAALGNVEQEFGGKVNKKAANLEQSIETYFGENYDAAARVSVAISEAAQKYAKDSEKFNEEVRKIVSANKKYISQSGKTGFRNAYARSGATVTDDMIVNSIVNSIAGSADGYRKAVEEYKKQEDVVNHRFEAQANAARKDSREKAVASLSAIQKDWQELVTKYQKASGKEKEKLAVEVYKQQRSYANVLANNADYFDNDKRKAIFDKNVENMATYEKGLRSVAGEAIRTIDAMERAETKVTGTDFTSGGESAKNPWGSALGGESTDWKNMTAEQLVNRRKQMKDFVNAIQTDTDVQSVLKEDAALKKAIENGMSSDMRTVIEWYNTERLKIQDELHARHLTNTGDWMDPKKQRGAKKQFRDEMDAYLHELDAYYTERKTRIEEAGTDEGLTEAEIRNRTLNNEMEWQQRRAELQKLYSRKQKEVTQEELDAIYHIIAERTGDSESFVKAQIAKTNQFVDSIEKSGEKGAAIVHRWMSQVELDTERSYLKGQQALTKQMRAIEAIIDKERPFNGITKSLQESLATMDILTGEMRKEYNELMKQGKDMTEFNAKQAQEELKRTAFMLNEAENAYSTTIDNVMDDMRQKGMTAWADWLSADPKLQEALMAQLRSTYDAIQDAIKKEASQLKKQAEIMWNNILMPDGKTTLKDATDRAIAQLGIEQGRVNRANSLIGAGATSERVADKLAIKQMQIQLTMQEHYYNLMKKRGQAAVDILNAQAKAAKERGDEEEATRKTLDAQHAAMALNLATAKEETELAKQREDIIARTEESQNRLYTQLKEWGDLLSSSMKDIFEASHAGDAEYYNERAKMQLTGKGGPGAGTYIVIDNEGTEDARAHYEYLDERAALERQHEIEQQNALAEAWRKVMDDINTKMNDTITDMMNAMWQDAAVNANTDALGLNTKALYDLIAAMNGGSSTDFSDASKISRNKNGMAVDSSGQVVSPIQPAEAEQPAVTSYWPLNDEQLEKVKGYQAEAWDNHVSYGVEKLSEMSDAVAEMPSVVANPVPSTDEDLATLTEKANAAADVQIAASDRMADKVLTNQNKIQKAEKDTDGQMVKGTQSAFAKMTQAANLYGIAYQAMSNDNLSSAQKFEMIALQAVGQGAIAALTTNLAQTEGEVATQMPGILGKAVSQLGPIAGPAAFAVLTGILGGLMGMAVSKIAKSKSQIAQVTGASASAGRLATGMLTYAEGNVDEFTDPGTLTPGRQYNVDAADGRTYRARYMGSNPKTHLTNGPEFHLSGERGREMIIDAGTTRQITMNDNEIWHAIQTLSGGGRLSATRRRGRGVRAFADGNLDDFEEIESTVGDGMNGGMGGFTSEQLTALQSGIDRQNDLLERALTEGIKGVFNVYGKGGLVDSYDTGKKTVTRHGERY